MIKFNCLNINSKTTKKLTLYLLVLLGIFGIINESRLMASDRLNKNLPLVFDPQTRKYFTNGSSKFLLKRNEEGGIVERIEVSVDNEDYQAYDNSIQFKTEGKHSLKFRAVDPVNHWSPVQFIEVFVDKTPPLTEVQFSEEGTFKDEAAIYLSTNATLKLSAQDNLSGVASIDYSWDKIYYRHYSSPIKVERQGKQTLYYHSIDRVGNEEPLKQMTFIVDSTAPVSTLRLEGLKQHVSINDLTYISDSIAVTIDATDNDSKVKKTWVSVDEQPAVLYSNPIYLLKEGPHTVVYHSEDNVGNIETPKKRQFFTVSTPPTTTATPIGMVVNTGGIYFAGRGLQLRLQAKEQIVGLEKIEYKIDEEPEFHPSYDPIVLNKPGIHVIKYRSIDRAGNIEPTKTYTVNIYEVPPETTLVTAQPSVIQDGISYSPAPNVVTFNVSNSMVGVKATLYSLNDGPFMAYQGPITLNSDQKSVKMTYKSIDKLGNEESPKIVTFNMMNSTPSIDLFISNGTSLEEQMRTNYLEQAGGTSGQRKPAADENHPTDPDPTHRPPETAGILH